MRFLPSSRFRSIASRPRAGSQWSKAGLAPVAIIMLTVTGCGSTDQMELEIRAADEVVYSRSVEIGEEFSMTHIHSLTERMVRETFSVSSAGEIRIEELWFDSQGANLPAGPEEYPEYTTTYEIDGDEVTVTHPSYPLPTLDILVSGPDRERTLHFADGHSLPLHDIVDFGTPVEVTTNRWKG